MIFSNIKNWKAEEALYPEAFKKAFHFLETSDIEGLATGEHLIDGKDVYAIVMDKETDDVVNRSPEAHQRYIDIQFMFNGTERIGFLRKHDDLVVKEKAIETKDLILYENEVGEESFVTMRAGDFAIFFPEDVHRPLCLNHEKMRVRKVVVKVAVTVL
jgi:YhcH/YjgK/YiaL family protein